MGGGGDGGAQAEADRVRAEASQDEYQIAQDKAKINALFGNTEYDYNVDAGDLQVYDGGLRNYDDVQANITRLEDLIAAAEESGSGESGFTSSDYSDTGGGRGTDAWADQLATAQGRLSSFDELFGDYDATTMSADASSAFDTREASLQGIYDNIFNEYTYEQDRQYGRKSSDVLAMLSNRGLADSSVGQSIFDRLGEIRDTNTKDFEEGASAAITRIRDADETTRSGLVRDIDTGGDFANAQKTALSDLNTNIENSVNLANSRDLTNLFKQMDELYGQKQYVDAYNTGQTYGSSNVVTPGSASGSSGSVLTY